MAGGLLCTMWSPGQRGGPEDEVLLRPLPCQRGQGLRGPGHKDRALQRGPLSFQTWGHGPQEDSCHLRLVACSCRGRILLGQVSYIERMQLTRGSSKRNKNCLFETLGFPSAEMGKMPSKLAIGKYMIQLSTHLPRQFPPRVPGLLQCRQQVRRDQLLLWWWMQDRWQGRTVRG